MKNTQQVIDQERHSELLNMRIERMSDPKLGFGDLVFLLGLLMVGWFITFYAIIHSGDFDIVNVYFVIFFGLLFPYIIFFLIRKYVLDRKTKTKAWEFFGENEHVNLILYTVIELLNEDIERWNDNKNIPDLLQEAHELQEGLLEERQLFLEQIKKLCSKNRYVKAKSLLLGYQAMFHKQKCEVLEYL